MNKQIEPEYHLNITLNYSALELLAKTIAIGVASWEDEGTLNKEQQDDLNAFMSNMFLCIRLQTGFNFEEIILDLIDKQADDTD